MPNIGQISFNLVPPIAEPGQLGDNQVNHMRSYPAAEVIYPGRFCTLAADGVSCQMAQETGDTTLTAGVLGFAVLLTAREGTGANGVSATGGAVYQPGDMVPILRKGSLYAEWKGTTQTAYATPNYYHSSTVATDRGKLTDASIASTAGSEVSNAPSGIKVLETLPGTGSLALVEVNLPGAA